MIKRYSIKKIMKVLVIFLVVFLLYLFPSKEEYKLETKEVLSDSKYHEIYLIDKNNMVSKTKIIINSNTLDNLVKELIETLIIDGKYSDRIPSGFSAILPSDTELINENIEDNIVNLNFNKKILEIDSDLEEKMIESIIYTITSINNIKGVKINIEGNSLNILPKNNIKLDEVLTRKYGINKEYDITGIKDITNVTIYYASKFNDQIYYVPVTKYINSNEDKIKIIINELSSRMSYNTNLMSYLNSNTKLLDYSFSENKLDLNFNEYLFDNKEDEKVLEEVIHSICYSIEDTLEVNNINFFVNNKEIK